MPSNLFLDPLCRHLRYDLSAMSGAPNKKWKWLLAMLSHRFAQRLRHYAVHRAATALGSSPAHGLPGAWLGPAVGGTPKQNGAPSDSATADDLRSRERELLETCLGLLQEVAEMGGHGHDMIRASVHELIAESYLQVRRAMPPALVPSVVSRRFVRDLTAQSRRTFKKGFFGQVVRNGEKEALVYGVRWRVLLL
jgi:hypothetical protein